MDERERKITDNMGLVHSCCHRFKGRGVDYDDLFQAGCIGLIKAVDNFDEGRGVCFSTYAVPSILGEIRRIFRDGGTVKISRSIKELAIRVKSLADRLQSENGCEPPLSELAERLGVSSAEVAEALCAAQPTVSLTVSDDEREGFIDLPCEDASNMLCESLALDDVVSTLDERDRSIIKLRYFATQTQNQTARQLGMTQVQVSRREKKILDEMRRKLQI
jgi:RNA polymerase sporulation-specific sigma factor